MKPHKHKWEEYISGNKGFTIIFRMEKIPNESIDVKWIFKEIFYFKGCKCGETKDVKIKEK